MSYNNGDVAPGKEAFVLHQVFNKNPEKPTQKPAATLAPILFARVRTGLGKPRPKDAHVLLDSGASSSIISHELAKNLRLTKSTACMWATAAGTISTNQKAKVQFMFPELSETKIITWNLHVFEQSTRYDLIIGRDLLQDLGILLDFKNQTVTWDEVTVPMRDPDTTIEDGYQIQESEILYEATERTKRILDAKYEAVTPQQIVDGCDHLTQKEKEELLPLLEKFKELFDGSLGSWKGEKLSIEVKAEAKPYHARAFPIPKSREEGLKKEISRLCKLGVLKKVNHSEWAAPAFIIPKKDGSVRFITDFRELNKRIKRKPFPIPKIQDLLLKLEGFQYGTSLDLNMGYYHIELDPDAKKLCTIVLPWGKYEYQRLPMGLCNSPDIFQEKMGGLMADLDYVRTYIDDLLVFTSGSWTDHLQHLEQVFKRLKSAGLKVNAKKSFFGKGELEYLGYWITRKGIQPLPKKIEAILAIKPPKDKRQLRRFIGMINFYRDMWIRRSEILAPLTELTSKTAKWVWGEKQEKAFQTIKKVLSKEVLLAYPNFDKEFHIHTAASHTQLGAAISQDDRPIAFYSRKLSPTQQRYTTTERELLAIVETLKEFKNILLGQRITVYTGHKNLISENTQIEWVLRWRLLIEEFSPNLIYLPGHKNVVADALSRLELDSTADTQEQAMAELFSSEELTPVTYPLQLKRILEFQQKDKELLQKAASNSHYHLKSFSGGGKTRTLICYKDKIVLPVGLQEPAVQWYHTYLCHPGINRTELTLKQHFTFKNLRETVLKICSTCPTCQKTKKTPQQYGHLPEKEAEATPWEKLCVDLIGPYHIKNKTNNQILRLWCVTMIDPATGWFEIRELKDKEAITVANLVEQTWLTRYPWPTELVFDRGTEFMGQFAKMIEEDYGIIRQGTTTRNPQANSIIERIHQTLGNILRTFELHNSDLTSESPWDGILSAAMFALRATYHTTLQATPCQLVFGRDAMLNVKFEANWQLI